jgi:hypothetical protein
VYRESHRYSRILLVGALLTALAMVLGGQLFVTDANALTSDQQTIFGPRDYIRTTATPVDVTATYSGDGYTDARLVVTPPSGHPGTTSAVITVDGKTVVAPADFTGQWTRIERPIDLRAVSEIIVEVRGEPGSGLTAAVTATPLEESVNPLDVFLPDDALAMTGVDPNGLNAVDSTLTFTLSAGQFSLNPDDTSVSVNGKTVPASQVNVTATTVTVQGGLADGRDDIAFNSMDADGRQLYHNAVVWAGSATLPIRLLDESGEPFTQPTAVTLSLADDHSVSATATTSTGSASFADVPNRTMLVDAVAVGNIRGSVGGVLTDGTLTVVMRGFGPPSPIDNNDFSQGTAGWDIGTAPVSLINHQEDVGPAPSSATQPAVASLTSGPQVLPAERRADARQAASTPESQTAVSTAATLVDQDLQLGTSGQGEQGISRTFTTDPGVSAVRLRYRFVTSEVPGGYFGTQYNDYFRVSLRSQQGGGNAQESNSMNAMGLATFDGGGATGWRDVTLPVDEAGGTIAVNLAVANVADGILDSAVIVDFVEQIKVRVLPTLSWNSTTGGLDLRYTVQGDKVPTARNITVQFATGPTYAARTGAILFTKAVPVGTAVGSYGPFHIGGDALSNAAAGVTHLVAASNQSDYGAVPDVRIGFGTNANPAVVSKAMITLIKNSLRVAGQAQATITSTARTPEQQAQAMFTNLTNPAHTIAQNIATQHTIYSAAGDAVINTFATDVAGMTLAQVQAASARIRGDMVTTIKARGCLNVSHHCADPAELSVVDIGAGAFNNTNGALFVAAATARGARVIDERRTNSCYHLELHG